MSCGMVKKTTRTTTQKLNQTNKKNQIKKRERGRGFPGGPVVKNLPCHAGAAGLIPGWGTRIPQAMRKLGPQATTTEPEDHMKDPAYPN